MKKTLLLFISLMLCLCTMFSLMACGSNTDEDAPSSTEQPDNSVKDDHDDKDVLECEHIFGDWTKTEPTCTKQGVSERICTKCGEKENEFTHPLGHEISNGYCGVCSTSFNLIATWNVSATKNDNVTANLYEVSANNYLLDIVGTGDMVDYNGFYPSAEFPGEFTIDIPWFDYSHNINSFTFSEGITHLGDNILYRTKVNSIEFPTLDSIANHGCFLSNCYNIVEIGLPSDALERIYEESDEEVQYIAPDDLKYMIIKAFSMNGYYYNHDMMSDSLMNVYIEGQSKSNLWTSEDGYVFYEKGNECYLVNYVGPDTKITLPETCNGKRYMLDNFLFFSEQTVKDVVLPEGIYSLTSGAFLAVYLDSITIPKSLRVFEDLSTPDSVKNVYISDLDSFLSTVDESDDDFYNMFAYYDGEDFVSSDYYLNGEPITKIVIPEAVTVINRLPGANSVKEIIIHDNITEIGDNAFNGFSLLENISLPKNIKKIGENAFLGCENLKSITIPASVKEIGADAFNGCINLQSIKLSDGITEIKTGTFANCFSLKEIIFPSSLTKIGSNAFSGCASLEKMHIPEGITIIGNNAFEECFGLADVKLPVSLLELGANAFKGCDLLDTVEDDMFIVDGWLIKYDLKRTTDGSPREDGIIGLPTDIIGIATDAIKYQYKDLYELALTSVKKLSYNAIQTNARVVFSSYIEYISADNSYASIQITNIETWCNLKIAFYNAYNGEFYNPSNGYAFLGTKVYYNSEKLTKLTIPDGVSKINKYAFSGITSIKEITISASVKEIEDYAFWGLECDKFSILGSSITIGKNAFPSLNLSDRVESNGCVYKGFNDNPYYQLIGTIDESVTHLFVPAETESIAISSKNMKNITSIEFESYESLKKLSNQISKSSLDLYINGEKVEVLYIPEGTQEIDFRFDCFNLKEVHLPDSLTNITTSFKNCNVYISSIEKWLTINKSISSTFNLCVGGELVTELVVPGSIEIIPAYAFANISCLQSVIISEGVKGIKENAFENCHNLTDIAFPKSIEYIYISHVSASLGPYYTIENVYLSDLAAWCNVDVFSDYDNELFFGTNYYLNGKLITDLVIPEGVTCIKNDTFTGMKNLISITLPSTLEYISYRAFKNTGALELYNFSPITVMPASNNPLMIENVCYTKDESNISTTDDGFTVYCDDNYNYIIAYSGNKKDIILPEKINGREYRIFHNALIGDIESITISAGLFGGVKINSKNLKAIYISDLAHFCSINFITESDAVNLYLDGAPITELVIPENVTIINNTFCNVNCITDVVLHENVDYIQGFVGCEGITSVTLHKAESIRSFYECENIKDIYFYGTEEEWNEAINKLPFENATVHFITK